MRDKSEVKEIDRGVKKRRQEVKKCSALNTSEIALGGGGNVVASGCVISSLLFKIRCTTVTGWVFCFWVIR